MNPAVLVTPGGTTPREGTSGASARLAIGDREHNMWLRVDRPSVSQRVDPFVVLALLPAMARGLPLHIRGRVSARLLAALPTIQDVFATWDARFRRVGVRHEGPDVDAPAGQEVACFFSGGIDSWYTLLKHRDDISTVVFVHGFDIALGQTGLRTRAAQAVHDAAGALGKQVIEVETNLREVTEDYVSWPLCHGAALGAVALLLSGRVRKIYIAASHTYRHLIPNGSHPLVDPLWSTESVEIIHDGCEATRFDKAASLAGCEAALRTLRVCWENRDNAYNCGRCRKCLSAMVNLHLVGALGRCSTFDRPLDLRAVARMPAAAHTPYLLEGTIAAARRSGRSEVVRALEDCLSGRYERPLWRVARSARRHVRRWLSLTRSRRALHRNPGQSRPREVE